MELIQVKTDKDKVAVRELSIEYLSIGMKNIHTHYGFDYGLSNVASYVDNFMTTFDQFMPPQGHYLLVIDEGQAVGMGGLKRLYDDTAEIKRMFVKPISRGKGYGKAIFQALIDTAKSDGYDKVRLDTFKFWDVANKLYRSAGFQPIDAYPEAEPDPSLIEHVNFMELTLTD